MLKYEQMKNSLLLLTVCVLVAGCSSNSDKTPAATACELPLASPDKEISLDVNTPVRDSYDYKSMDCVLDYSKSLTEFPVVEAEKPDYTVLTESESDALGFGSVVDRFMEIQSYYFDEPVIELFFAKGAGAGVAEIANKRIGIDVDFVQNMLNETQYSDPLDVIGYVMAHEFGHYMQEVAARSPVSAKNYFSVNGNVSLFYLQKALGGEAEELTGQPEQIQFLIDNFEVHYLHSHAEVDAFATLSLLNNEFDGWDDVLLYFDNTIALVQSQIDQEDEPSTGIGAVDFQGRKNTVETVLANKQSDS